MFVCGRYTNKGYQITRVDGASSISDIFDAVKENFSDYGIDRLPEFTIWENHPLFKIGDMVEVRNNGGCYSTYDELFDIYPELLKTGTYRRQFKNGDVFTVVDVVPHTAEHSTNVVVMKDDTGNVALCTEDLRYLIHK